MLRNSKRCMSRGDIKGINRSIKGTRQMIHLFTFLGNSNHFQVNPFIENFAAAFPWK